MSYDGKSYVLLTKLPIPPSSNNQYALVRRGHKTFHVPSKKLTQFQAKMQAYPYTNPDLYLIHKQAIHQWLKEGYPLEIRCLFFFRRDRIFTKKNTVKRLDVSNRIKALHDCLCKLLEIDDSLFFRVTAEKVVSEENLEEMTCVEIMPC